MFKTHFRVVWSGVLLVGTPVYVATKVDPSQTMNALIYGGVAWLGINMVMYIKDVLDTPMISAYDEDDISEAYTDGYIKGREDIGVLARQRESVIRKYYEDKLSSVGDNVKNVTINNTHNNYSTNITAVPQLEDNNIIDTKLIGA